MSVTPEQFKSALGSFATGVTVITTSDKSNYYGVTINAFSSLSLTPPLVHFNLNKTSFYHELFKKGAYFAVNILGETQRNLSQYFSSSQNEGWDGVAHTLSPHNCPLIDGAARHLECQVSEIYDGGDHSIIIGKVEALSEDSTISPLLYFQGKYHHLGEQL